LNRNKKQLERELIRELSKCEVTEIPCFTNVAKDLLVKISTELNCPTYLPPIMGAGSGWAGHAPTLEIIWVGIAHPKFPSLEIIWVTTAHPRFCAKTVAYCIMINKQFSFYV